MEKKICSKCKIEKYFSEFRKSSKSKIGIQSECKSCANARNVSNRDEILRKKKLYTQKTKKKKSKYDKLYREKNKEKKNEYTRNYRKNRRKNDPVFRITESMRSRIRIYFKSNNIQKYNKTFNLVGILPKNLKKYLETKFVDGMTWDNYGEWHIDHIIPISSAKNEEEVYKLCHYSNLQPLWAIDNNKKSNKY